MCRMSAGTKTPHLRPKAGGRRARRPGTRPQGSPTRPRLVMPRRATRKGRAKEKAGTKVRGKVGRGPARAGPKPTRTSLLSRVTRRGSRGTWRGGTHALTASCTRRTTALANVRTRGSSAPLRRALPGGSGKAHPPLLTSRDARAGPRSPWLACPRHIWAGHLHPRWYHIPRDSARFGRQDRARLNRQGLRCRGRSRDRRPPPERLATLSSSSGISRPLTLRRRPHRPPTARLPRTRQDGGRRAWMLGVPRPRGPPGPRTSPR